ncbi:hypothetical protein [Paenibacillus sp. FSL K6-1558]|uniref:hypothetical protein n=1 Tax=Paenibacillus sp. FSL K6-1558 TaxID=2921473 RepID=UPI0030FBC278
MAFDRCCPRNVWIPILFSKGHIPVAKASTSFLQLKSFPPPVFKLVDEVIKAQASLDMKPAKITRIKGKVTQILENLSRVCGKLWIGSGLPLVQLPLSNAKGLGL